MRWQAIAFFVTMIVGAAVYDESFVQTILTALGIRWSVTPEMAMRFPIYLTLGNAVLALWAALNLRESRAPRGSPVSNRTTWQLTFETARWIAHTPLAVGVILAGMCLDSVVRLFLTVASNYYRFIAVPEAAFGLIGSGFALIGFLAPALARRLVTKWKISGNFVFVAALTLTGLAGASLMWPIWGLLWLVPLGMAISLTQFYVSHYLNKAVTDPRQRATVLSFRGLAFNLAYGGAGLLFAGLTHMLGKYNAPDEVFTRALGWLPWYFLATVGGLAICWRGRKLRSAR